MLLMNLVVSSSLAKRISNPLNSNELLYTIAFTYVNFAAIWIGRHYVIAVDYPRYVIIKHCPIDSNKRKSVSCE
jgi:hypothetical protein